MSSLFSASMPPLTGGGFWVAFAQVSLVYYGFAAAIHWVIPAFFEVESVQVGERRKGQVRKEALLSIGEIVFLVLSFCFRTLSTSSRLSSTPTFPPFQTLSSLIVKERTRARIC